VATGRTINFEKVLFFFFFFFFFSGVSKLKDTIKFSILIGYVAFCSEKSIRISLIKN
jgi:hypothetical protein